MQHLKPWRMSVLINPGLLQLTNPLAPLMRAGCQVFRYHTESIWHPHQLKLWTNTITAVLQESCSTDTLKRIRLPRDVLFANSHLQNRPITAGEFKETVHPNEWTFTHSRWVPNIYEFHFILLNSRCFQDIDYHSGKTNTVVVNRHWLATFFKISLLFNKKIKPQTC